MAAYFRATVAELLETSIEEGMLRLTTGSASLGFDLKPDQHEAWVTQWSILKSSFGDVLNELPQAAEWTVLLEFEIAGRRKRLDCVVLSDSGIVAIEFKVGADEFRSADRWQLREYCWNLRDFHRESCGVPIAQILVATKSDQFVAATPLQFSDRSNAILDMICCGSCSLARALLAANASLSLRGEWNVDPERWEQSPSAPTPSVVDCARRLFEGHDVREIEHAHADNTDAALDCIRDAVFAARKATKRIICFVTGVPGAGKTLVGLNAAYRKDITQMADSPVCFASGNQPLLEVLQAALVMNRAKGGKRRREVAHDASTPVRNVHDFAIGTITTSQDAPPYRVVVFDEAQRVWSGDKLREGLAKREKRKKLSKEQVEEVRRRGESEPDLLLDVMERHNWCVVIALVGGGQEIHDGEAGLPEWGRALERRSDRWEVWAPGQATDGSSAVAGQQLFESKEIRVARLDVPALHLSVSKRSYRAERYAEWVNYVVSGGISEARETANHLSEYPVRITRDLQIARRVIREFAGTDLRSGLLATSGAVRLRADGIEVSPDFRHGIKWSDWFLRSSPDFRSSNALEVAATEFECQGLEVDWCIVCWGGDFVWNPGASEWQSRRVRMPAGKPPQWYVEKVEDKKQFARNKYRVLLTRARVGVVIFVPRGCTDDFTRDPTFFDATAGFLESCGALTVE
jgi:hypothetical protein